MKAYGGGVLWVLTILLFAHVVMLFVLCLHKPVHLPPKRPWVHPPVPPPPCSKPPVHVQPVPLRCVRPPEYAIVGYLESATQGMLPLYARPSPTHRHRYNYHTRNNNEYLIRLPIVRDGRDCTNRLGCDELYDKDVVTVPGMPDPLTVHMYSKEF